jgi:hypothetical protein
MSSEQKQDRLVLENLDRIVAGEKLRDESGLDDDTRAALEITRELSSWSKSPSKEFKKQLKAQLIHQLAEQEKQQKPINGDLVLQQILRRPAWQLTVAAIIMVAIIAIITVIVLLITKMP